MWIGHFTNGNLHGKGIYIWNHHYEKLPRWTKFIGNFKNNEFHGEGTLITSGGETHKGCFVDGSLEGFGKSTFCDGSFYDGNYYQGLFHGEGLSFCFYFYFFTIFSFFLFIILFLKNTGILKESEEQFYKGSFVMGKESGFGVKKYGNGDSYEGSWLNGLFEGFGVYHFADGRIYSGNYVEGKRMGHGREVNANHVYEGEFVDNNISWGSLVVSYVNENGETEHLKYVGSWKNNLYEGEGILDDSYIHYQGSFVEGKMEGKGSNFISLFILNFFILT